MLIFYCHLFLCADIYTGIENIFPETNAGEIVEKIYAEYISAYEKFQTEELEILHKNKILALEKIKDEIITDFKKIFKENILPISEKEIKLMTLLSERKGMVLENYILYLNDSIQSVIDNFTTDFISKINCGPDRKYKSVEKISSNFLIENLNEACEKITDTLKFYLDIENSIFKNIAIDYTSIFLMKIGREVDRYRVEILQKKCEILENFEQKKNEKIKNFHENFNEKINDFFAEEKEKSEKILRDKTLNVKNDILEKLLPSLVN